MTGALAGNRGKLLLAGVLVVGAGALLYWQTRSAGGLPDSVNFVCVESGEFFQLDRHNVPYLPAENPESGTRTLLPCAKGEDGVMRVSNRCRNVLAELGEKNHYVDAQTLEVRPRQ